MITPLKRLFSIILKFPFLLSCMVKDPNCRRQTSWLFIKRGEFGPSITEGKSIQ